MLKGKGHLLGLMSSDWGGALIWSKPFGIARGKGKVNEGMAVVTAHVLAQMIRSSSTTRRVETFSM